MILGGSDVICRCVRARNALTSGMVPRGWRADEKQD